MANSRPTKAHDRSHRLIFTHRRAMEDLLRGFVDEPWVDELDFSTLCQLPSDYVTGELGDLDERIGDVVWKVQTQGDREPLYVVVVLEFQSTCDLTMALRVLVYVGLFYQRLLKEHPLRKGEKLPPVLPLVMYNGEPEYNAPLDLSDLIAPLPGGLGAYRPSLRHLVIDERRLPDELLVGVQNVAAALFRLERSAPEEIGQALSELSWLEDRDLQRDLALWLRKVLLPQRLPGETLPEIENLDSFKTILEEKMQTWTERWLMEGHAKGRAEGRAEGEVAVVAASWKVSSAPWIQRCERV